MGRPKREAPRASSADWPNEVCSDPVAEVVRLLALNLLAVIGSDSVRSVAERAGVEHSTVHDLVAGNSWPDVATVARLELGLDVALWPAH